MPRGVILCPMYSAVSVTKTHFSGYILKFAQSNLLKIAHGFCTCSVTVGEMHIVSSEYSKQSIPFNPIKITSTRRWYVPGALFSPNGILTN